MSWISKVFNYVPKKERKGISLGGDVYWEIFYCKKLNFSFFLRNLIDLLPFNSVLYLEGGLLSQNILAYIKTRKPAKITQVSLGTIWPRPRCLHMEATSINLEGLADLSEEIAFSELAVHHLHVYNNKKVLLEWYDAFSSDVFYLSKEISESKVKNFCIKLGIQYRKIALH